MHVSRRSDRVRATVGVIGELLITAGVVVGLFAVYTLFWTGVETQNVQKELEDEFEALSRGDVTQTEVRPGDDEPEVDVAEPLPGDAFARIRIPRLGDDWSWIIVSGVDLASLARGPGHYPSSADPGDIGNVAVAGHRATYGEPFAHLDRVQIGDEIVVEREGKEFRYVVTESFITAPSNTGVLLPVPGKPGVAPEQGVITLTTCHPRWGSSERLIVHATLTGSTEVGS